MKIKTNVRAGKRNRSGGTDDSVHVEDTYVPPVSRCVGI
jgi:hypothetical protein